MLSLLGRVDFASKASKRRERCITEVIFCFAKLYVPAASWFATVGDGALDVPKNGSYICLSASCFTIVGDGASTSREMLPFLRTWRPAIHSQLYKNRLSFFKLNLVIFNGFFYDFYRFVFSHNLPDGCLFPFERLVYAEKVSHFVKYVRR